MDGGTIGALFMFSAAFIIYFAPGIVAEHRGRDGSGTIVILNLLLGWTVIGWLVLLIVAFSGRSQRDRDQQDEQTAIMRQMLAQQQAATGAHPAAAPPARPAVVSAAPPPSAPPEDTRTLAEIMDEKGKSA